MIPPDANSARQLAYEHQARLRQDWKHIDPSQPDVVEGRRRPIPRLAWLLTRLRPARFAS